MKPGNRKHKWRMNTGLFGLLMLTIISLLLAGCAANNPHVEATASQAQGDVTLVLGAYSVAKDALQDILPIFQEEWKAKTGQKVSFQESYEASGTQARAIVGGFKADVGILAMENDFNKISKAGLLREDWMKDTDNAMITRSIVVMGTRQGNPLGIKDFEDLTKPGVKVLYPNPKTSGGAQWDINAIYGAGLKRSETETGVKDPESAKKFLAAVHRNIESMDKSGRASMAAFEYGVGDVIVTYENELLARISNGVKYDIVVPKRTILIENPAAVIDSYADEHGVREVADAFVAFLHGSEAQDIFAKHGFRPVEAATAARWQSDFIQPEELFDISYLGGWKEVASTLYSPRGIWYQVLAGK